MNLTNGNITIRDATSDDAELLCTWWNDGEIMAHAGFPNGLGITVDEICEQLANREDDAIHIHIIELNGNPIGEMNYRNESNNIASIGIKICDFASQEKGLGTTILAMFIDALFTDFNFAKIIIDTNTKNTRAQHVYEKKLGFKIVRICIDSWHDQLGEAQSSIDYELTKEDWASRGRSSL
jgi:RimJ/RimL family protein N-acetyltransferase